MMSAIRFFVVLVIFAAVSIAWMVLGTVIVHRTGLQQDKLAPEVDSLWGPPTIAQSSPFWTPSREAGRGDAAAIAPSSSQITANIRHQNRAKGLLWFSTFSVDFHAQYVVPAGNAAANANGVFVVPLPDGVTQYDERPAVTVDGQDVHLPPAEVAAGRLNVPLTRSAEHTVTVRYTTRGQDRWLYAPGDISADGQARSRESALSDESPSAVPSSPTLAELRDFSLTVNTDFRAIDYPPGTRSPDAPAAEHDGGMQARWQARDALTRQAMGIEMPRRTNAGPIVYRMTYFAPVSLLFFFTVLFTVVVLKKVPLHPMHYLFIAAGFFAFHILLGYLADLMENLHLAFLICSAVSVLLVVSYMRLAAGVKFAVLYVGAAQLIHLVGFSYAFFWVGKTGLTVTIGAILTLFVLMQATGRVDWQGLFKRNISARPTPPPPPWISVAEPGKQPPAASE